MGVVCLLLGWQHSVNNLGSWVWSAGCRTHVHILRNSEAAATLSQPVRVQGLRFFLHSQSLTGFGNLAIFPDLGAPASAYSYIHA